MCSCAVVSGRVQAGGGSHALRLVCITELKGRHRRSFGYPGGQSQMPVPETGSPARWSFPFPVMGLTRFFPATRSFCFAWLWEGLPPPVRGALILVPFGGLISPFLFQVDLQFSHLALLSNHVGRVSDSGEGLRDGL